MIYPRKKISDFVQYHESNIYASQVAPDSQPETEKYKGRKKQNYNVEEDVRLAMAWVNISNDALFGANQNSSQFWGKIQHYFLCEQTPNIQQRTIKSLQNRWNEVRSLVNKFHAIWLEIDRRHRSPTNEEDVVKEACIVYQGTTGKMFNHIHAWEVLRKCPKYMRHIYAKVVDTHGITSSQSRKLQKNLDGTGSPSLSSQSSREMPEATSEEVNEVNIQEMNVEEALQKPLGQKSRKKIIEEESASQAEVAKVLGKMVETRILSIEERKLERAQRAQWYEFQQKRQWEEFELKRKNAEARKSREARKVEIEQRRFQMEKDAKQFAEDRNILSINPDDITNPEYKAYMIETQMNILARLMGGSSCK